MAKAKKRVSTPRKTAPKKQKSAAPKKKKAAPKYSSIIMDCVRYAQSLAAYQLGALHDTIAAALRGGVPDMMTRAHLEAMQSDVERARNAHYVIPLE